MRFLVSYAQINAENVEVNWSFKGFEDLRIISQDRILHELAKHVFNLDVIP